MSKPTGHGGQDMPDFGVSGLSDKRVGLTDLSELAVRMGSFNLYDRLGTTILQEDFSKGYGHWYTLSAGTGSSISLWGTDAYALPFSVRCIVGTGVGAAIYFKRRIPFAYVSKLGMEIAFSSAQLFPNFTVIFNIYDGTYMHQSWSRISAKNNYLQIQLDDLTTPTIDNPNLYVGSQAAFHVFKLVMNIETQYYVRATLDEKDYDLTSYKYYKVASAVNPHVDYGFIVYGDTTQEWTMYVDSIIGTINEPD